MKTPPIKQDRTATLNNVCLGHCNFILNMLHNAFTCLYIDNNRPFKQSHLKSTIVYTYCNLFRDMIEIS